MSIYSYVVLNGWLYTYGVKVDFMQRTSQTNVILTTRRVIQFYGSFKKNQKSRSEKYFREESICFAHRRTNLIIGSWSTEPGLDLEPH